MLIDVHAHFYHERTPRADWKARNLSRFDAGERIGITVHVASILGTWGLASPIYFPSPADVVTGNDVMVRLCKERPDQVRGYITVNPNYTDHALAEIERCRALGLIGVKLAASRRANDRLLDPICRLAADHGLPILHHIWQRRRRDWPGQEASDGAELCELAGRHPQTRFILAHIGGGGDWIHSLHLIRDASNVFVDLSGSGVDGGMLEQCVESAGTGRLLWGADITLCTGLAKLRYLESLLTPDELDQVRWRNAAAIFPPHAFPAV
jgi:predicted TIM-barrel fold metal-dependent hydrolase